MDRQVLFHRDYRRFTGGHLKVWDYYNHVRSAAGWRPEIMFSAESVWDAGNPWAQERGMVLPPDAAPKPDVFFVAGLDWQALGPLMQAAPRAPVINLLQGPAHVRPEDPRYAFLGRPAVRICVSDDLRDAVLATGKVAGPVHVIPNGMDRSLLPAALPAAQKDIDLLVAASKNPGMGLRLQRVLEASGLRTRFLQERLPRAEFQAAIRGARMTLFLPRLEEGFYLPALEGMALETLVICPDCVGNRSFCLPGVNCLRPDYSLEALAAALETARRMTAAEVAVLREQALATVAKHSLMAERRAFLDILSGVSGG